MVVGFYNPYYRSIGGGEYYLFQMMKQFLPNHKVVYFTDVLDIRERVKKQFDLDIHDIELRPPITSFRKTYGLDKLFWYSDGSFPFSLAKQTYLIFQYPVPWVHLNVIQKVKLSRINKIIVNSYFTKKYIDKTFNVDSCVIYPSIDFSSLHMGKKEKLILSVGRFTEGMNTKRQDVLIEAFKQFVDSGNSGWRMVIAGGLEPENKLFFEKLKLLSSGYPIQLETNVSRKVLNQYYSVAMFYWHAAGYGIEVEQHPEQVEHFGISVVEAMASGCIPCVYNAGGPAEVVKSPLGIVWNTKEELLHNMTLIIKNNSLSDVSRKVHNNVQLFHYERFNNEFRQFID